MKEFCHRPTPDDAADQGNGVVKRDSRNFRIPKETTPRGNVSFYPSMVAMTTVTV